MSVYFANCLRSYLNNLFLLLSHVGYKQPQANQYWILKDNLWWFLCCLDDILLSNRWTLHLNSVPVSIASVFCLGYAVKEKTVLLTVDTNDLYSYCFFY